MSRTFSYNDKGKAAGLFIARLQNGFKGIRWMVRLRTPGDVCQRGRPTCVTDFMQQALVFFVPGVQVLIWAAGQTHTVRGRGAFRRQVCSLSGEDNVSIKNKTMTINADQN